MKLRIYFVAIMCLMVAASCNDEIKKPIVVKGEEMTFTATTENVPNGPSVVWRENDAISVFDYKTNNKFATGEGGQTVPFKGTALTNKSAYIGLYPYTSGAINVKDGTVSVSIPASQSAVAGGFNPNYNYAVAYSHDAGVLDFHNIASFLKITLNSAHSIMSVKITANNGEKIAGAATVAVSDDITITPGTSGSSAINMTGSGLGGTYYILATPQTLSGGYTIQMISGYDMKYEKVVNQPATLQRNTIYDLGSFMDIDDNDWIDAGPNPNPTTVPGLSLIKSSFKEGEFNVISEPGFEKYPDKAIGYHTSWWTHPDGNVVAGHNSATAFSVTNNIPGWWMDVVTQSVALRSNTDYKYSLWGHATTPHVYTGMRLSPFGPAKEIAGPTWAPNAAWAQISMEFNTGTNYFGDVFAGIWGDAGVYFSVDDFRLIPKGYDKTSMEPLSSSMAGSVGNVTYSELTSLGKAVTWLGSDGKLRIALSDFTLNSTHYDTGTAIAAIDNNKVNITGFLKDGISITPILAPAGTETSIIPNSAFTLNGKTYLHYYAKTSNIDAYSWNASSAGFLVSENDGETWTKGTSVWSGTGTFVMAGFCQKDGYLYMAGSKARRTSDTDRWANMYVARIDVTKDFTDPTQWDYWNGSVWSTGNESVCAEPKCCITVGACSEPALVYNAKFGRFMMIYRSAIHGGLVYRDADAVDGYWSGEKIITNDDEIGSYYAPSVLQTDANGDILMAVPKL